MSELNLSEVRLSELQQRIINRYQKGFPLVEQPYVEIAEQLAVSEQQVIEAIEELHRYQALSRVGAVFDHKKAGASTLAAMAVPEQQLDKIAAIVNQFEQVNHNYEREHDYNLWFVVTASDLLALNRVLEQIELLTGLPILVLPMEASYHIDLGFTIDFASTNSTATVNKVGH
ncbi:protein NirD [Thalassotalea insulae]|uniref:siroheme decarboxylase n=1 Tax=Thalassotalea insulae TaxID=2056778 RepID=A0ABQ6GX03_9GAMM|nr:Lrp/AsnC family transcriptional regulator [Thalassotalea insulae]GLX80468.1 protein NirD [Thalassotalea insulae]